MELTKLFEVKFKDFLGCTVVYNYELYAGSWKQVQSVGCANPYWHASDSTVLGKIVQTAKYRAVSNGGLIGYFKDYDSVIELFEYYLAGIILSTVDA